MKEIRKRLLEFLINEVSNSKEQINTTDIILDFLKNEFHEEDEIERIIKELKNINHFGAIETVERIIKQLKNK